MSWGVDMANVTKTVEKKRIRRALVSAALAVLERDGWKVSRVKGGGKSRIRRITKNGTTKLAALRTSQDLWIAFPRNEDDTAWATLGEVDVVVASSVDDSTNPQYAQVHIFDAAELRERFDRAYAARKAADHSLPVGRGVWVSLYRDEATDPPSLVGAGIGNLRPPIARIPLDAPETVAAPPAPPAPIRPPAVSFADPDDRPLTIPEAKLRLARTLGVDPGSIRITVEG
jgi:hypothetical protein